MLEGGGGRRGVVWLCGVSGGFIVGGGECGCGSGCGWMCDWDEEIRHSGKWSSWWSCWCGRWRYGEEGVVIAGVAIKFEHVPGCAKAFGLDVRGKMIKVEVFTCIEGRIYSETSEIPE